MFDVNTILSQLSTEQKLSLLAGKTAWSLTGFEHLNIADITITDGPHGVRLDNGKDTFSFHAATAFASESAMAATFNETLIHQTGEVIALECHHFKVGVLLGPGVNGKRSPLAGRNFEYYSEDPYLTGKIAAAFINGVQSQGIGTSLKHFVGNEQETRRFLIDSVIGQRALHEIYLRPFEIAIKQANPWTVMAAYNAVNGIPCCQNEHLLQTILRDEWQYDGLVMSDWDATRDKVASHQYGLDLEMPGPSRRNDQMLTAIESGELDIEQVNLRAAHVLDLIKKILQSQKSVTIDWQAHHKQALAVAQESIVLLKNQHQCLPLNHDCSLAVIGQFAEQPRFQGGGSSAMNPQHLTNALSFIKQQAQVVYAAGYDADHADDQHIQQAVEAAKQAKQVVLFTGTTDKIESEGFDRQHLKIPEDHIALIKAVYNVNPNIVIVLSCGSAVETRQFEDYCQGILLNGLAGQASGEAISQILFGDINPSGKLSETFPIRLEHNPSYEHFPGGKDHVYYHEELLVGYRFYDTKQLEV